MKHAFLIIAHNEYPVLEVLLSMLDDERNDIYLHIDKRATELFQQIKKVKMQKAGFYLIENPIKVYWGDISQVQVEYLLFETALSHGPYAYYHLLSGTDLPIKSQDYIHAFFQQNAGKEFVGFWQDAAHQRDLERKVFRYYFFTKRLKDKEHLLHGITALIRNLILAVQKISHYRRKQTFEFKKGGNWISITENAVKYLLQYKEIVLNRMKYTHFAQMKYSFKLFYGTLLFEKECIVRTMPIPVVCGKLTGSMAAPIYGKTMIIRRLLTLIKYLHGNSIQTRWELSTRFKNYI